MDQAEPDSLLHSPDTFVGRARTIDLLTTKICHAGQTDTAWPRSGVAFLSPKRDGGVSLLQSHCPALAVFRAILEKVTGLTPTLHQSPRIGY